MPKPIKYSFSGYSLIELAIAFAVIGALSATAATIYGNYIKNERIEQTKEVSIDSTDALGRFRAVYGRYPCPSSIDAVAGDAEYGHEDANCKAGAYGASGSCVNGICTSTSANASGDLIVSGTLPYKILGMQESALYDGYGNKLTYAVTAPLTSAATFNMANGGISVVDEDGDSIIAQPDTAHFVTVSHGKNEFGAYNREGVEGKSCISGGNQEQENCDDDSVFTFNTQSTEIDDIVNYFTPIELSYWEASTTASQNIYLRGADEIAVGANTAADLNAEEEVKVREIGLDSGMIMAKDSKFQTNFLCEYNPLDVGLDCFKPSLIGGLIADGKGMSCGVGEFLVGIKNGAPICKDEIYLSCPVSSYITGISVDGKLQCSALASPPCPESDFATSCGTTKTIPTAFSGSYKYAYSGNCHNFIATGDINTNPKKTSAQWASWIADGPKDFAAISSHVDWLNSQDRNIIDCDKYSPPDPLDSPAGALVRDSYLCNAGGVWQERVNSHERRNFGTPFPASPIEAGVSVAETGVPYSVDFDRAHANENHDCWCREDLRVIPAICDVGYTGNKTVIQKFKCPATTDASPTAWDTVYTDSTGCTCDGSGVDTTFPTCASVYNTTYPGAPVVATETNLQGFVVVSTPRKCVAGVSVPDPAGTTIDKSGCNCPLIPQRVNVTACPAGYTNSFLIPGEALPRTSVQTATVTKWKCPGLNGSGDVQPGYWEDPFVPPGIPPCTCNSALYDFELEACPPGLTGTGRKWKKEWDCAAVPPAWEHKDNWQLVEDNCVTCSWKSALAPHLEEYAYGKKINTTCACGEINPSGLCHDFGPDGKYYVWNSCSCVAN